MRANQDILEKLPAIHTDEAIKVTIEQFFEPMILFTLPELHQSVDWEKGYEFLDKELQKIHPKSETRRRYVDKLIRVHLHSGQKQILLVHIESQAQRDEAFPKRMWEYYFRITDYYDHLPVVSIAILADKSRRWRPSSHERTCFGTRMRFEFTVLKLIDYESRVKELQRSDNPFALVVIACLKHLATTEDLNLRYEERLQLYRSLFNTARYNKEEIRALMALLEYLLILPPAMEIKFEREWQETVKTMLEISLIPRFERRAMEKGIQEGLEAGQKKGALDTYRNSLLKVLRAKFGRVPRPVQTKVRQLTDLEILSQLLLSAAVVNSLEDFLTEFEQIN